MTQGSATPRGSGGRLVFANHLRGLAASSVVLGHLVTVYWGSRDVVAAFTATPVQPGPPSSLYPLLVSPWYNLGALGVATFFLISGLVVPISLEHHSRVSFLCARALRIYPTFIAGTLLCLGAIGLNERFWDLSYPPGFGTEMLGSTFLLVQDLTATLDFTLVAWTLCIEIKFYLLVALLSPAILRGKVLPIYAVAVLALIANLSWQVPAVQGFAKGWPQVAEISHESTYIVYMMIGVLFNFHLRGMIRSGLFGVSVLILSTIFVACFYTGVLGGEFLVTPVNYGYALLAFRLLYAARRWVGPCKPVDALAAVSFPLYVVHSLTGYSLLKVLVLYAGVGYRYALVLTLAAVLAIATGLHLTVERWSIAMGKRLSKRGLAASSPASVGALLSPRRSQEA